MRQNKIYETYDNVPLQASHYHHKLGDNPSDTVLRNGVPVNIEEHNARILNSARTGRE